MLYEVKANSNVKKTCKKDLIRTKKYITLPHLCQQLIKL
jgi:hypothetical protein